MSRVFFLALVVTTVGLLTVSAPGQPPRPAPHYVAGTQANQAEGRRALEDFRAAGPTGVYWLEIELRVMPHRGEEHTLRGQIVGTRGADGPLTRLDTEAQRWLIASGPHPAAWTAASGSAVHRLTEAETLLPVAGTDLTLFDLQMPFLYWKDFVYEGLAKIRGRPAYSLLLYPPAALAAQRPDLAAVRVALDTQFHAFVQAELLGPDGQPAKTISVLDLKKVNGEWMVKSIDLRNLATRDKTRFTVTAVALNLALASSVFTPEALAEAAPQPAPAKIERF